MKNKIITMLLALGLLTACTQMRPSTVPYKIEVENCSTGKLDTLDVLWHGNYIHTYKLAVPEYHYVDARGEEKDILNICKYRVLDK